MHRGRQSLLVVLAVTSNPETDKEGFLRNTGDWNPAIAERLADLDGITLTDDHWEVNHLVRDYFQNYRFYLVHTSVHSKVTQRLAKPSRINLVKQHRVTPWDSNSRCPTEIGQRRVV